MRDEWDPDGKLEKPVVDFEVEWVYGYRGKDASGGRNIYQVGELIRLYISYYLSIYHHFESLRTKSS